MSDLFEYTCLTFTFYLLHTLTHCTVLFQRAAPLPDLAATLSSLTATTTNSTANTHNALVHACVLASSVSKKAAELAFGNKGRSMTAPDVIERIGEAFVLTTGAE